MPYLLDTCAISELSKLRPDRTVKDALTSLPRDEVHLSAITVGEIRYGIGLVGDTAEKARLTSWLDATILAVFGERIVPIDTFVSLRWGDLLAGLKPRGFKMQLQDSLI